MSTSSDLFADRWLRGRPTYVSGMDRCTPQSALAADAAHGRWRVLPYRSELVSGTAIVAGQETQAPSVRLAIPARGWHAISIGVWRLKNWYLGEGGPPQLLVRLAGEPVFSILQLPTRSPPQDPVADWQQWTGGEELSECFWRITELGGGEIEFGQPSWLETGRDGAEIPRCAIANVAYVKLVPLSDGEVRLFTEQRVAPALSLHGHNDLGLTRTNTPEELQRHLVPFQGSDFTRIYWEAAMGDLSSYFQTRNRTPEAPGRDDFLHSVARNEAACWRRWRTSGHDPMRVASDQTHAIGLEFHVCHRLGGFHLPPVHDYWEHGDSLYREKPEWRSRDRSGNPTPRLSFAYPEVRSHVIETFREMVAYDIDGVCLLYNRRHPVLEYEPPLVAGYREQHGKDPRELEPDDPTWLRYRAGVLTTFTRELRQALDLPITAIVMSAERENLANGLDPQAWIAGGLVDTLVPFTDLPALNHAARAWRDPSALDQFAALTAGTACQLAPCLHPSHLQPAELRRTAAGLAEHGADALFFWWADVGSMVNYGPVWSALRDLGHLGEIEAWRAAGEPTLEAPVIPLQMLGDWDCRYVSPA